MCSLQRNYDVIRNWERFETGPLTVPLVMKYQSLKKVQNCTALLLIFILIEGLFFALSKVSNSIFDLQYRQATRLQILVELCMKINVPPIVLWECCV